MLACSHPLREAVARILTKYPNWEDRHSYQLNAFLRYHLNDALGEQSFSKYAPAIARAELESRRNQYVIEALGETVHKTVDELRSNRRREPLGVPSTVVALLERSRGEPQAILKEAMEFREHSRPLRNTLEALAAKYLDDTSASRFEIEDQIKELGQQLRRAVKLEVSTTLWDAVEVRFIIGIPVPSVSGTKLKKWYLEHEQSKRTAVLTELVKWSAYSDSSTNLYEKLRKRSTRNTT